MTTDLKPRHSMPDEQMSELKSHIWKCACIVAIHNTLIIAIVIIVMAVAGKLK